MAFPLRPLSCSIGTVALQYSLKSGSVMPPALFLLLRIVLAMWALFWFHMKFKVFFFQFGEQGGRYLDGDSIESINYSGQYGHFHAVDSFYPLVWNIFVFICVLSDFLEQLFVVLLEEVLHFLC